MTILAQRVWLQDFTEWTQQYIYDISTTGKKTKKQKKTTTTTKKWLGLIFGRIRSDSPIPFQKNLERKFFSNFVSKKFENIHFNLENSEFSEFFLEFTYMRIFFASFGKLLQILKMSNDLTS